MGTRSLTYVYNSFNDEKGWRQNEPIICLYRQYDGYPTGHGAELAEYLDGMYVVNGLGAKNDQKVANGMGCLAAQLVAHFKNEAGQFYLHTPVLGADHWQEYEYHVFDDKVIVYSGTLTNDNIIFEGTWQEYSKWVFEQVKLEAEAA